MRASVLAVVAVVWHLLWVASVFDIYFTSPVVSGCEPHAPSGPAPAARLVLFVADGMRADRCFELDPATGVARAPFLRSVAETRGAWGVSHTRVPTESRPGHVALLGGLYEDVSAITRGWRSNPVAFDTLFNRSSHAFLLGSPDVVPMFADPLPAARRTVLVYDAAFQEFAGDPGVLDAWVRDQWERHVATHPLLCSEASLQLLHLLGTDSSGHTYRPGSAHYLGMVTRVDALVRLVAERMEAACPDGRTAFVFTADHGMSDKGSHGAGDPTETETPLVVWGSGLRGPLPRRVDRDPPSPRAWALDHLRRRDVEQADVAALMAAVLGIATPVNNVGVVPLDLLAGDAQTVWQAGLANARQLVEQLRAKQAQVWERSRLRRPADRVGPLRDALRDARTVRELEQLMARVLQAVAVYDSWDAAWLRAVVSLGLAGWMAQVVLWVCECREGPAQWVTGAQAVLTLGWAALLWAEHAPPMYYAYVAWAIWVAGDAGARVWLHRRVLWRAVAPPVLGSVVAAVVALELMVWGFYERWLYGALLAAMALLGAGGDHALRAALGLLALFPLLPAAMADAPLLVVFPVVLCAGVAVAALPSSRMRTWHTASALTAAVLVVWGDWRRHAHLSLHPVGQALGWLLVVGNAYSLAVARHHSATLVQLGLRVLLSIVPVHALLSVAYETLALVALALALGAWVRGSAGRGALLQPALLYVLFTYAAFFGTGNTGSLSSFELSSTYRLVTVFSPWLMGALLTLKAALPFVLVGAAYGAVVGQRHRHRSFFTVLLLSDVMALSFFFLVRNHGSWREIGLSISHFGMANAHVLFQLIMFELPRWLGVLELSGE